MRSKISSLLVFLLIPAFAFCEVGYVVPWGEDHNLSLQTPTRPAPEPKLSLMGKAASKAILFHHRVLTHISGPRSHFRPTSSQYMFMAIQEHGFLKGYMMGCDRLLRENQDPWVYRTILINNKLYKWDRPKSLQKKERASHFLREDFFSPSPDVLGMELSLLDLFPPEGEFQRHTKESKFSTKRVD